MKRVALALAALCLSACATKYHQAVSVQRYDATTLAITASGNNYTAGQDVLTYALRRSAEETVAAGHEWFTVLNAQDQTRSSQFTTPTQTFTNASAYAYGNMATGQATSTTYGGNTYTATMPGISMIVQMGSGPKPQGVKVYDAREVMQFTAHVVAE